MSNSFRAPASILKNARKRPFLDGRGHSIARGSSFAMNDILYARPISSLSNGVYLMSLRPSVAEQSARDPSGVGPFFAVSIFPFPMLNQWSTRARADATPSVVPGPNFNTQVGPYQSTCRPNFVHLAPTVFELLTFSCMTHPQTYVRKDVRTYVRTFYN